MNASRWSWITLLLTAAVLVGCHFYWMTLLPERIATHFDGEGRPNGWMSRSGQHGLLAIHLGMAGFIVCIGAVMHLLPPTALNTPQPAYWRKPENFRIACEFVRQWTRWFASALLVWGTVMDRQLVLANLQSQPRLDMSATWLLTAAFLATTAVAVVWMFRFLAKTPKVAV
jgi:uncharacterized membrane protein